MKSCFRSAAVLATIITGLGLSFPTLALPTPKESKTPYFQWTGLGHGADIPPTPFVPKTAKTPYFQWTGMGRGIDDAPPHPFTPKETKSGYLRWKGLGL